MTLGHVTAVSAPPAYWKGHKKSTHQPWGTRLHCGYLPGKKERVGRFYAKDRCVVQCTYPQTHVSNLDWALHILHCHSKHLGNTPSYATKTVQAGAGSWRAAAARENFYCHHLHFAAPSEHISPSITRIPTLQAQHSTAIAWIWAATPLVPLWVQEPSFRAQLSIITTGRTVGTSLLSQ